MRLEAAPLLLFSCLLLGCVGPVGTPTATPAAAATASADDGLAAIRGIVIDEETFPIEGATVSALQSGAEADSVMVATSDAGGQFRFMGLAPGTYFLQASKPGYVEAVATQVRIQEGDREVKARVVLSVVVIHEPFQRTFAYSTYNQVYFTEYAAGSWTCITAALCGYPGDNRTLLFPVNEKTQGPLMTFVAEMQWTRTSSLCKYGMRSDVYSPEQKTFGAATRVEANPYYWSNLPNDQSPTRVFIPREGEDATAMLSGVRTERNGGALIETSGNWTVMVGIHPNGLTGTGVLDVSCAFDQRASVWVSLFYGLEAAAQWSVIPK